ncbi:hypothetical protein LCGC14_2995120 [marine sediment metagenome]|uniref:Uncharacterized protein n=1 Tax=marine sediment metagenome TaxID=412755 RepID=A0A0F8X376_9ZZZZ
MGGLMDYELSACPTYAERLAELDGAYVVCPFCKEGGFDLIGLRGHYDRAWCETLDDTPIMD